MAARASGDSGGPVLNATGELIGITDNVSAGTASLGSTTYVRLGEPSTKAWIEANTALPVVVPDLSLSPAGPAMRLTWDAAATGYRLQASGDLTGWTDLGGLITGSGTYDDVTADRRRFYRLAKP